MEAYQLLWIISLVIGLVVIAVVALLLYQIKATAQKIDTVARDIWTQGKLTANNTIQIPIFLSVTNRVATKIYNRSLNILRSSAGLKAHADKCPGCPHCILKH